MNLPAGFSSTSNLSRIGHPARRLRAFAIFTQRAKKLPFLLEQGAKSFLAGVVPAIVNAGTQARQGGCMTQNSFSDNARCLRAPRMEYGLDICIPNSLFGMTGRVRLMTHFPQGTNTFSAVSQAGAMVTDTEGRHAQIASIERGGVEGQIVIRLDEGPEVSLPVSLLEGQDDGSYRLPFAFDRLPTAFGSVQPIVIKVLQEELQVGKRVVDTGKGVRVHKAVTEREEKVDVPLMHDELQIDRVAVGQIVNTPDLPVTRYEGDILVVPIIEEVLVVQKQFLLKEEVRITKKQREEHAPQTVVLKSEQVTIERFDEQSSSGRNNIPDSSI